jgi:hypothetical protein
MNENSKIQEYFDFVSKLAAENKDISKSIKEEGLGIHDLQKEEENIRKQEEDDSLLSEYHSQIQMLDGVYEAITAMEESLEDSGIVSTPMLKQYSKILFEFANKVYSLKKLSNLEKHERPQQFLNMVLKIVDDIKEIENHVEIFHWHKFVGSETSLYRGLENKKWVWKCPLDKLHVLGDLVIDGISEPIKP